MAILLKSGALFLHIPKTGGNWITEVLEEHDLVFAHVGGSHSTIEQLLPWEQFFRASHKYGKPNRPLFRFCFVRHPLRWYESWYQHMGRQNWVHWVDDPPHWYPGVRLDGFGPCAFDEFITRVLDQCPGFVTEMYSQYLSHGMHFVGRQETLADDLMTVLKFLEAPLDETRVRARAPANASEPGRMVWRPDLQEAVERAEFTTFERFGYTPQIFRPANASPGPGPRVGFQWGDTHRLPVTRRFQPHGGHGWQLDLPALGQLADITHDPYRSPLVLLEDGRPLPCPHAMLEDIRVQGHGRYCHWMKWLVFSTSDNTDPNTNGRRYEIEIRWVDNAARHGLGMASYADTQRALEGAPLTMR